LRKKDGGFGPELPFFFFGPKQNLPPTVGGCPSSFRSPFGQIQGPGEPNSLLAALYLPAGGGPGNSPNRAVAFRRPPLGPGPSLGQVRWRRLASTAVGAQLAPGGPLLRWEIADCGRVKCR